MILASTCLSLSGSSCSLVHLSTITILETGLLCSQSQITVKVTRRAGSLCVKLRHLLVSPPEEGLILVLFSDSDLLVAILIHPASVTTATASAARATSALVAASVGWCSCTWSIISSTLRALIVTITISLASTATSATSTSTACRASSASSEALRLQVLVSCLPVILILALRLPVLPLVRSMHVRRHPASLGRSSASNNAFGLLARSVVLRIVLIFLCIFKIIGILSGLRLRVPLLPGVTSALTILMLILASALPLSLRFNCRCTTRGRGTAASCLARMALHTTCSSITSCSWRPHSLFIILLLPLEMLLVGILLLLSLVLMLLGVGSIRGGVAHAKLLLAAWLLGSLVYIYLLL